MVKRRKRSLPYISVCGPLASGKTTVARLLAAQFGWSLLLEDIDANPYLQDYYEDMSRWGFRTVTAFLVRALTLQDELSRRLAHETVCQDWHFAEHYDIYGVHVFDEGIITEKERTTFQELHGYLMTHAPTPDLVIVLTADPGTLLARAAGRKRPGERDVPLRYLEHLVVRHRDWARTLNVPSIVIDTVEYDVVRETAAAKRLIARVQAMLD